MKPLYRRGLEWGTNETEDDTRLRLALTPTPQLVCYLLDHLAPADRVIATTYRRSAGPSHLLLTTRSIAHPLSRLDLVQGDRRVHRLVRVALLANELAVCLDLGGVGDGPRPRPLQRNGVHGLADPLVLPNRYPGVKEAEDSNWKSTRVKNNNIFVRRHE